MDRSGSNSFRSPFLRPNAHFMAAAANQDAVQNSKSKTLKGIIAGFGSETLPRKRDNHDVIYVWLIPIKDI
ncbi:hypothetical protein RRG08_013829 [Elysia crispata]|uniref:Uncharacterized protein n=1 Tax=Elysia crispata TaxID=231223 RepID=A0AAE1BCY4_9GAST|nr:hypothetical protein RRG08_013829 [Elysia crispata]